MELSVDRTWEQYQILHGERVLEEKIAGSVHRLS